MDGCVGAWASGWTTSYGPATCADHSEQRGGHLRLCRRHPATPQWEGAADGPEKRKLAQALAARLEQRWSHGGVVHHGQGKWYPGEDLPALERRDHLASGRPGDLGRPLAAGNPWDFPVVEPGSKAAHSAPC